MTKNEQRHLDELMDTFDFHRVARAMRALSWRWASVEGHGVPDEPHIRARVREHAVAAITQATTGSGHAPNKGFVGTGGFHLEAFADAGRLTGLYLRFTLTEISTVE